jgi:hemerythrin
LSKGVELNDGPADFINNMRRFKMAVINWSSELSVGVDDIDQQHKRLIGMVNDLDDAMRKGKGKEILGRIIDKMNGYTVTHFKTEEDLFTRFGYPESASHRKEHASFVNKSAEIKGDFLSGKLALSIEVMGFLGKWWKDHILGTDRKYSKFFAEKGVK